MEIFPKLKTTKRCQKRRSSDFIVSFEHISHLFLVFFFFFFVEFEQVSWGRLFQFTRALCSASFVVGIKHSISNDIDTALLHFW